MQDEAKSAKELLRGELQRAPVNAIERIERESPTAKLKKGKVKKIEPIKAKVKATPKRDPRLPKPGSVIKRTYKDKEHKVKVKTDSFEYRGKEYGSLTAVAKAIIGSPTEINGYAFFALNANGGTR